VASSRSHQIDYSDVLESLYEAALQPDLLPQALHSYARAFNASVGLALDLASEGSQVIVSPNAQEMAESYANGWWKLDIATQRGRERQASGLVTNLDLTTAEERATHPYYQEFCQRYECFWSSAYIVQRPGASRLVIGIRRPEECGPFLPAAIEAKASLGRHVARAIDIAARLSEAGSWATALCDALTQLGHGVIGLGPTGRILFTNPAAESLCGDGLRISNGAILAASPRCQRAVDGLIAETLAVANKTTTAPPRPVALTRPSGRAPIVLYGVPVPHRHGDVLALLGGRPQALIMVIEPDAARGLDEQLLREMFSLSPGEARVAAAIATGVAPKDVAASFRMSEGTIRVVLKRVFRKLGVSRQSELVLLLAPLLRK
jgi:DNA-binding CsgD family transcriptional regulator